jgi:PBSX family phage terminase large subunit
MKIAKTRSAQFRFSPFSKKALKLLTWWRPDSPYKDYFGIIAEGSIRSTKTVTMIISFTTWAMENFNGLEFGLAGKTIGSFKRNVLTPMKRILPLLGYDLKVVKDYVIISKNGVSNTFHIFGGKDEASQDLIQGMTLMGMLFDEVALMPASFIDQAVARCDSIESKVFFNCNPGSPYHHFKVEHLDKAGEKKYLILHFTMEDNLSMNEEVRERYKRQYKGVFFQRMILGLWVMAEGRIYDMWDEDKHIVPTVDRLYTEYQIAIDHGVSTSATTFLLFGKIGTEWYLVKEYYYSGAEAKVQKTDVQYMADLTAFIGNIRYTRIIVDPAAAAFIVLLKQNGFRNVTLAKKDVADGIQAVANTLFEGKLFVNDCCENTIKEFSVYSWDIKAGQKGIERPLKMNDHCMDALRYFVFIQFTKPTFTFLT